MYHHGSTNSTQVVSQSLNLTTSQIFCLSGLKDYIVVVYVLSSSFIVSGTTKLEMREPLH